MRIPHNINRNMFDVYLPSKAALNLVLEGNRTLKAEDLTWEESHPPRLTELCLTVIVANFEKNSRILAELPCADRNFFFEILPTNLPLPLVLDRIEDGIYWKRMVNDRWKNQTNHVQDHGFNWKRMYMERHVQELVEEFTPEGFDEKTIDEMCRLASDFVRKLDLRQLKVAQAIEEETNDFGIQIENFDHINLSPIIAGLEKLTELHIQFGIRHIGSNYKKSLFELSEEDCRNIGAGVNLARNLKVLRIHQSLFDDQKVIQLLSTMTENQSLEKLEIINCLVGNDGATAIASYLKWRTNIRYLNLSNNKIGEAGIEALSYVLTQKNTSPVEYLNLKFNGFGDDGLRFLASALIREAPKIAVLDVSCCNLTEESGVLLAEMIARNEKLREINLSNNKFGESVGRAMESSMKKNLKVTFLDLRMTGIPNENLLNIGRRLQSNRIRARKGDVAAERELEADCKPEVKEQEEENEVAATEENFERKEITKNVEID